MPIDKKRRFNLTGGSNTMFCREKTCCFSGHRNIKDKDAVSERIYSAISSLYQRGITHFISGMAVGFDMLAARQVIRLRSEHSEVRLICALPGRDQTVLWDEGSMIAYKTITEMADEVINIDMWSGRDALLKRDRYMVDNSEHIVAYLARERGGTFYTVNYARKKGLNIINLA